MSSEKQVLQVAEDGSVVLKPKVLKWIIIGLFGITFAGGGVSGIIGMAKESVLGPQTQLVEVSAPEVEQAVQNAMQPMNSAVDDLTQSVSTLTDIQEVHEVLAMHPGADTVIKFIQRGIDAEMGKLSEGYDIQQNTLEVLQNSVVQLSEDLNDQKTAHTKMSGQIDLLVDAIVETP